MKKILSVILMLSLIFSVLALAVSAEALTDKKKIQSMVVFGDSISTGYGLEGNIYTRTSYANLVAQALELDAENGYVNYAVDGYTSEDILRTAVEQIDAVRQADLILLTCGGNDILSHAMEIAVSASGAATDDLMQVAFALLLKDSATLRNDLYSESNEAIVREALDGYRANMETLVTYLRKNAPDARIVFLTQYNPLSGIPIGVMLDLYTEDVIGRLNAVMTEVATAGGCEVVDTHAVMTKRGMELSNILSSDIHPNAAGHAEMAETVKAYLGIESPSETENTTTLPDTAQTDPAVTTVETTSETEPLITTSVEEITTTAPEMTTEATTVGTSATETAPVTSEASVTSVTTAVIEITTAESVESEEESQTTAEENTSSTAETEAEQTDILTDEPKTKGSATAVIVGAAILAVGVIGTGITLAIRKK